MESNTAVKSLLYDIYNEFHFIDTMKEVKYVSARQGHSCVVPDCTIFTGVSNILSHSCIYIKTGCPHKLFVGYLTKSNDLEFV